MKVEQLMYSMNDIKDKYIMEYTEKAKIAERKFSHRVKGWGIVAACLALMLICTPMLIHIFNPSGIDDPMSGIEYEFKSYEELCEILPENGIISKIPNSETAEIECYGICPENTIDFTDIKNYSYLSIDVSYDNNTGVAINCTLRTEKTLEEICQDSPLKYPADRTEGINIGDTEAYFTYYFNSPHGEETLKINGLVFIVNNDLYEVSSGSLDKEALIQYVEDMLTE